MMQTGKNSNEYPLTRELVAGENELSDICEPAFFWGLGKIRAQSAEQQGECPRSTKRQ